MTNPENDQDPTLQTVPKGDEKPESEAGGAAEDEGGEEEVRLKKPLLGRYHTLAEVEKALGEGDSKVRLSGEEKNKALKALEKIKTENEALRGKVVEAGKPAPMTQEEQDGILTQVGALVRGAKTDKDLGKAFFNLFETYQKSTGLVTRQEITAREAAQAKGGQILTALMSKHGKEEFTIVAPTFREVWDRQPAGVKATATPETIEDLYQSAKSKVPADKFKKEDPKKKDQEDAENDKAGSALGVGQGTPPKVKKTSEEETVEKAVRVHKDEKRLG